MPILSTRFALAQTRKKLARVGVLWDRDGDPGLAALKDGLRELGWMEGSNVELVIRLDPRGSSRLTALAEELVGLGVDVLFVTDAALPAAIQAAGTLPIVCPDFYDPVSEGFATGLGRARSNLTGISWQSVDSVAKRLELVRELLPRMRRIAMLFDPNDQGAALESRALVGAATRVGLHPTGVELQGPAGMQEAVASLKRAKPDALLVSTTRATLQAGRAIGEFAAQARIPLVAEVDVWINVGAVLIFGPDHLELYKRAAYFVDRLLKGARPSDLPIEQPTKFVLIVNRKAAKALGLTIPESLVSAATKVAP